jgi:hypothetical protein
MLPKGAFFVYVRLMTRLNDYLNWILVSLQTKIDDEKDYSIKFLHVTSGIVVQWKF